MLLRNFLKTRRNVLFIVMILAVTMSPTVQMQSTWHHDIVADALTINNMSPRSQAVDAMGYPHIAYGYNKLYHSWYNGSVWQTEIVDDAPQTGGNAEIVFDSLDQLHIGYLDDENQAIKYAVQMPGGWSIESVPVAESALSKFSMSVDDADNVAFIIDHPDSDSLSLYYKTSTGWSNEVAGTYDVSITDIALTFHGAEPRIVYSGGMYGSIDVKLLYKTGSGWNTAFLDSSGYGGFSISVCTDSSSDITSAAYLDTDNGYLKFVQFQPGGPPSPPKIVADVGADTNHASLAMTPDNKPVIAYYSTYDYGLYYAQKPGTTWSVVAVPVTGKPSHYHSATVDASGIPQITYVDSDTYALNHVGHDGSTWTQTEVNTIRTYMVGARLTSDKAGTPWVMYGDNIRQTKYVGRWTGSEWTETDASDSQKLSSDISIAMDSSGMPHAVVQNDAGEVRYGVYTRSGWQYSVLDNPNLEISGDILVLDSQDQPRILCYDNNEGVMKIASRNGSAWEYETVLPGNYIYAHLCIDSQDQLTAVAESPMERVSYLSKQGSNWTEYVVDSCDPDGFGFGMELDSSDNSFITYYCPDDLEVRCAFSDNGVFTIETAATEAVIPSSLSICMDVSDQPVILFGDQVSQQLKTAFRLESGWAVQVVNPDKIFPYSVSTTMDTLGRLMVSYVNFVTGDVMLSILDETVNYWLTMYPLMLETGDDFYLHRQIRNTTTGDASCIEYLLLEVYGEFWYGPSWTQEPDAQTFNIPSGTNADWTVFDFPWPIVEGSAAGLRFWGGIVNNSGELLDYDMVEFGWQ